MSKLLQEAADKELNRAISEDEQANSHYYRILRRFISGKSPIPEEKIHHPDARLDAGGLKEIDGAWLKLQDTEKNLRKAYMKLYVASLKSTFTPVK
jgi:hypothetical protein